MNRIRELRKAKGLNQADLAREMNVAQNTLSYWENAIYEPDYETLFRLAEFFNTSVAFLMGRTDDPVNYEDPELIASLPKEWLNYFNGDVRKAYALRKAIERDVIEDISFRENTVPIPVLGRVQAGVPVEAVQEIIGEEKIPADMAMLGKHFALLVKGDSMSPGIYEGDRVIVRQQSTAENGDTVVVLVNGEDATIKRFYKSDQGVTLVPLNPTYKPLFFSPSEVEKLPVVIIGKVVELRRKI